MPCARGSAVHETNGRSNARIAQRSEPTGAYEAGPGQVSAQYLNEEQLGELGGRELGAWKAAGPFLFEPIEQPSESGGLGQSRLHVNPRRQYICQQPPASRIEENVAADMGEVTAITDLGGRPAGGAREQRHCLDRRDIRITAQDECPGC